MIDRCPSLIDQAVLASFIEQGHFARHLKSMRTLYTERQRVLADALHEHVPSSRHNRLRP